METVGHVSDNCLRVPCLASTAVRLVCSDVAPISVVPFCSLCGSSADPESLRFRGPIYRRVGFSGGRGPSGVSVVLRSFWLMLSCAARRLWGLAIFQVLLFLRITAPLPLAVRYGCVAILCLPHFCRVLLVSRLTGLPSGVSFAEGHGVRSLAFRNIATDLCSSRSVTV